MSVANVIGEGSFGCVHKPSLKCKDKKISYKKKISKIMLTREAMSELNEYTLISEIDKDKEFFLGVPIKCKVNPSTVTIKSVKKCKNLKRKYFKNKTEKQNLKKMSLLVLKDGGHDLTFFAKKFSKIKVTEENIQNVKKFWLELHRLFRGILVFQKHDIAHHDIKPQNIVYNITTNRINFIDFGHMRNMKREMAKCLQSDNWIYENPFWNYPFEIQFLNKDDYFHFANYNLAQKERFLLHFIKDLQQDNDTKFVNAFRIFMDYMLRNKKSEEEKHIIDKYLIEFRKLCLEQVLPTEYPQFLKKSIYTLDVYGLGLSMQYLLEKFKRFMKLDIVKQMEQIIFNMTTPNLLQRYTIHEAIDQYETILSESQYSEDYGIHFENHVPVKTHLGKLSKTEKKIHNIHTIHSLNNMDKNRVEKAMDVYRYKK